MYYQKAINRLAITRISVPVNTSTKYNFFLKYESTLSRRVNSRSSLNNGKNENSLAEKGYNHLTPMVCPKVSRNE